MKDYSKIIIRTLLVGALLLFAGSVLFMRNVKNLQTLLKTVVLYEPVFLEDGEKIERHFSIEKDAVYMADIEVPFGKKKNYVLLNTQDSLRIGYRLYSGDSLVCSGIPDDIHTFAETDSSVIKILSEFKGVSGRDYIMHIFFRYGLEKVTPFHPVLKVAVKQDKKLIKKGMMYLKLSKASINLCLIVLMVLFGWRLVVYRKIKERSASDKMTQ